MALGDKYKGTTGYDLGKSIGGAMGPITSLASSLFGGEDTSATDAANVQAQGAMAADEAYQKYLNKATDLQDKTYQEGRQDIEGYYNKGVGFTDPYRQAGANAMDTYTGALGLNPNVSPDQAVGKFRASPGYQFAVNEALGALGKSAAARGLSQSGGLAKELTRVAGGYADQEYNNYLNRLSGLGSQGAQLSSQTQSETMNTGRALSDRGARYAGDMSSLYEGAGKSAADAQIAAAQAQAAGMMGQADANAGGMNALSGALGGIGTAFGGPVGGMIGSFVGGLDLF